ncbi:tRNA pseudouridine(38/39) synthase isoform X2 [Athene noctua]|uniref:tRNA pseudouridine(38/39) synthase isoform X2 n=1 Tax=Athene noctua TaxID=126797 RepID=UPI003EBD4F13
MAEESVATDQERLLRRVQELEEEVKRLKEKLQEDKEGACRKEAPSGPGKAKKRHQRPFDFGAYGRRHVALKIAYLGWGYQGFASQENTSNTIEEKLFEALKKTRLVNDRQTSNYHRCGRTDKGVSAFGQVISLDLRSNLSEGKKFNGHEGDSGGKSEGEEELRYTHILNRVLPPDIRVLAWAPVEPDFSARFSCLKRIYRYFFPCADLDVALMHAAAQSMAVEFPLVLYDCEFENLQWLYDREVQEFNVTHLQQLWANHAVKTQVLHNMLRGLDAAPMATGKSPGNNTTVLWGDMKPPLCSQVSGFVEGVKARTYKPLLARPKCEGLEARIRHFVRRGRIESPPGLEVAGDRDEQPPESKRSHRSDALGSSGATEQPPKSVCVDIK